MMLDHLPALQVVLPLACAPLIVLLRSGVAAWLLTLAASFGSLGIAVALHRQVERSGPLSYALGGWSPPWGIEYRLDALSTVLLVLITLIASVVAAYARRSVAAEVPQSQQYLLYAMFCLCLAGLLGIVATGDLFNLFVFLEISSLASYVLIAMGRDRAALLAAYRYLIVGTIGATFYVIGVGLLYLMTGTLNMADVALRLREVGDLRPVFAALAFITVGMGLKLALFPLHQWLPGAYAGAPSIVSAFLAGTATKVSVYVLLRFYFTVFPTEILFVRALTDEVLLTLSVAAMLIASLIAVLQHDLKRLFAFSSVAQIGYVTLGMSLANEAGLTAGIVHLLNHGVTKAAIFLLIGGIVLRLGITRIDDLGGIGARMPWTSFGIVLGAMGLIGVPGTAGFVTKWHLMLAAVERGYWWIAAVIAVSSLLAVAYVWRFVETAYFAPAHARSETVVEAPRAMLACAWVLVLGSVYLGLDSSWSLEAAGAAARMLLEPRP